jgi:aryl-alcohol dehydrogenase-like predicted oxidoreductase
MLNEADCNIQDLIQKAWDHGVNMIDTAECYDNGKSELEMYVVPMPASSRAADPS